MKNNRRFKLVKQSISHALVLFTLITYVGCVKNVDCSINGEHVHLYINEEKNLSKYVNSEKEHINNFFRTNDYLSMTKELEIIDKNNLYIVKDNTDYINQKISENIPSRQSYSYGYIYGHYTGYGIGLNPATGDVEYYYGMHTGWHNGYDWQDISLDEYTEDKVRDITYKFKFYKINEDGTLSYSMFDSLDEITDEYKYFKTSDLVQKFVSDGYYLEKQKELKK